MIDVLYIFKYDGDKYEKAKQRLICSIDSIKYQGVQIYVIDSSIQGLNLKVQENIHWCHKPYAGIFNKSRSINYGVKKYVQSEYFIMSDIDIIYNKNHVKNMLKYTKGIPSRVIHYHCEIDQEFYSCNFNELEKLPHKEKALAPGLGLIHTPTFMLIQGYNEEFLKYSPEDQCFNERIWMINKNVIADSNIYTLHLWHEISGRKHPYVEQNLKFWPVLNKVLVANYHECEWGLI